MAKKKHEEHVNHERWMVSYADFITLLFATFTALFAMSNADKAKLEAAAKSIKAAFASGGLSMFTTPTVKASGASSGGGPLVIQITPSSPTSMAAPPRLSRKNSRDSDNESDSDSSGNGKGNKKEEEKEKDNLFDGKSLIKGAENADAEPTPTPTPAPQASMAMGTEGAGNEALANEIKELMQNAGLDKAVEVRQEQRGTVISLGEAAFFAPGGVDVLPSNTHQLDKIVNALRNKDFAIRIEGHTDNIPVSSGRFSSNWELSTLRASKIVEFMEKEYKFDPKALSASGYGDSRPIADNSTRDGRQKNRRVDIVILNEREKAREPK
jgi:chemotaxis protein MotB